MSTAIKFPKALRQMRRFNAFTAPPVPNTFSKKRAATTCSEFIISSLVAQVKYAMLARI
jgi:hypothetical protein